MHPGTAEGIRYTVNTTKGKRRRQSAICRTPRLSRVTARLRPEMDALPAYTPGRTVPGAIKIASRGGQNHPLNHDDIRQRYQTAFGEPCPL